VRVLILGGAGMLGHRVFKHFGKKHETAITLRKSLEYYRQFKMFSADNAFANIDAREFNQVQAVITAYRPEAVINCVGITNKGDVASDSILNIEVNSLFPQRLARFCADQKINMIHLSTDCVFSGRKGGYQEADTPDASDLYGRSKLLGEAANKYSLTIRTSIIGLELDKRKGLLEWFLGQKECIRGYRNSIFSGFTTHELSRILEKILIAGKEISGLMHVSSEPISKYDLLAMIKAELDLRIDIIPDMDFKCDRSLDSTLFQKKFGYTPPSWAVMIKELCEHIKSERL
jgi:dTDP-4-dehydrorhamnose reductase